MWDSKFWEVFIKSIFLNLLWTKQSEIIFSNIFNILKNGTPIKKLKSTFEMIENSSVNKNNKNSIKYKNLIKLKIWILHNILSEPISTTMKYLKYSTLLGIFYAMLEILCHHQNRQELIINQLIKNIDRHNSNYAKAINKCFACERLDLRK